MKPRTKVNNAWKGKLYKYFNTLSKKDLSKVKQAVYYTSKVNDCEIFNSGIMGGQRLIYKEIVANIPSDVKTVYIPFACGLGLTYYLLLKGYKVIAIDRMECVNRLADFLFKNKNIDFAVSVLKQTRPTLKNPREYLISMQEKIRGKLCNICFKKGDAFELLPKLIKYFGRKNALVYLGTPTVMENNKKFYQKYIKLEYSLNSCIRDDWDKGNESTKIRKLLSICKEADGFKYVFAGLGTGIMGLSEKISIFKEYFKHVNYIYKPYDVFDDHILFASTKIIKINKGLHYV